MTLLDVLATLCLMVQVYYVLVEGRYLMEVRLNGYTNPTGKCGYGEHCQTNTPGELSCCDSSDTTCSGGERCDSYFVYCLRPLGEVGLGCYANETRAISGSNKDDKSDIDFSLSTVLGLSNPQNLSGLGDAYEGIQLYIEVIDEDPQQHQPNEFVDSFMIDHNLTTTESIQQNYRGTYNIVTMNLTITVFCEENFGGSDCTQCVPGFTGPNYNEIDHCFGVNCSGNGECSMDGMGTAHCTCDTGFTGDRCQTNIDDCVEVTCSGNSQCVDSVNNFTCQCTAGFSGPQCSESDSVSTSGSRIVPSVAVLGGGIGGALLLLATILLLTTCSIIACNCHQTRESKMENYSDQQLQGKLSDGEDKKLQLNNDHEFELKDNEAYSSITHYIPTDDNVAYGDHQTALQISTEDNVAYGQIALQISTEDNVA